MFDQSTRFYARWILANAWSEGVGLGTSLLLAGWAAQHFERSAPGTTTVLAAAALAVVLGALLEGALVGWAQARVLRRRVPMLSVRAWVAATAVGAGAAWLLGMLPSTLFALLQMPPSSPAVAAADWLQYPLALLLGAALGPVLAMAQVRVLRRHAPQPLRWLWANTLAWALGMPLIFLGMQAVPWQGPPWSVALAVLSVCTLAGAAVGAVHGRWLLRMLRHDESAARHAAH